MNPPLIDRLEVGGHILRVMNPRSVWGLSDSKVHGATSKLCIGYSNTTQHYHIHMFGPHVGGGCIRALPRVVISGKPICGPAWTSITSTDNERDYQGGFFSVHVTVGLGEMPSHQLEVCVWGGALLRMS